MPEEQRRIVLPRLGKDHALAMPERQRRWEDGLDALRLVFEKHGVEILRPRLPTNWEKEAGGKDGYINSYVRDPWFTVGNVVIEGSLRFSYCRKEVLPGRDIFRNEVYPAACRYVAAPQPEIVPLDIDNGGLARFSKGGDVLVHGRHVFAGTSGRASTALGAAREGRVAVHEGALLDGLLRSLKDFVHIPVGEGDAMNLGTNGRPITPDVYVTGPAFRRIGDAAGKHGVAIEYVEFSISNAFGGACRCGTQALWLE